MAKSTRMIAGQEGGKQRKRGERAGGQGAKEGKGRRRSCRRDVAGEFRSRGQFVRGKVC